MSLILAKDGCPTICTLQYEPVCAGPPGSTKDQWQTFGNPCAFDVHNCENKENKLVQQKLGHCNPSAANSWSL